MTKAVAATMTVTITMAMVAVGTVADAGAVVTDLPMTTAKATIKTALTHSKALYVLVTKKKSMLAVTNKRMQGIISIDTEVITYRYRGANKGPLSHSFLHGLEVR